MSQYHKGKTNLDFTEARDSEWQWHQLSHMQVCTSLQTDDHASTPPLSFLQTRCPSCRPTNSIKALKATSVSALPCKTGNTEIRPLCVAVLTNTQNTSKLSSGHSQTILQFIKRSTVCTIHDQHRAQSIQPSDMHTVGVHHVCHDIGHPVSRWRFFG